MTKRHEEVDLDALTAYVLENSVKFKNIDNIVLEVCERTGWPWEQGKQFVQDVQLTYHRQLSRHKNWIVIPLGFAILIGGAALLFYVGQLGWQEMALLNSRNAEPDSAFSMLINLVDQYGYWLLIGTGMVIGGTYGIAKALVDAA